MLPLLAQGCSHASYQESIERTYPPSAGAVLQAVDLDFIRSRTYAAAPPTVAEYQDYYAKQGYVVLGTLEFEGESTVRTDRKLARLATRAGADFYVAITHKQVGVRHQRQRGVVIWGSGGPSNPQVNIVTPAQDHARWQSTYLYLRRADGT
ncbi:MAG: hypothetical protein K1X88_06320 [Nannocystaceae bacterium]|nr:hypothetical protein [Nannocystaceae bacterium]